MVQQKDYSGQLPHIQDIQEVTPNVDYADGDVFIFDNIKEISLAQNMKVPVHVILLCKKGKMQMLINERECAMTENEILICPANSYLSECMYSSDYEGKACAFTDKILQDCLRSNVNLWNNVMYIRKINHIKIEEASVLYIQHLYEVLRYLINESGRPYRKEEIQSVIGVMLLGLCGLLYSEVGDETFDNTSRKEFLFQKFLHNVSTSERKRHSVDYYAGQLHITPKYLSLVCKQISGKTALAWIEEYVMEDIRYYLRSSHISIKEVANKLGFPNLSFFGKYIKRTTGMSPRQLRRTLRE